MTRPESSIMMALFSLFLCFFGTCLHWGYVARRGLIQKMVLLCCICPSGSDRIICFASSVLCNVAISAPNWICLLPHRCAVASTMEEIVSQQMIDATRILKTITKIDVTTTRTVKVEQLSRDVRASIGYGNITMSALMTNQYSFPEYLSNLDVIVHITRSANSQTVDEPPPTQNANVDVQSANSETEHEPPPKRNREV